VPTALSLAEIEETIEAFVIAAKRAIAAGFRVIEIHAAHGYRVHEFFSPLTNTRVDQFGGSFDNRTRIAREIVRRVRAAIPDDVPLFTRISATDWVDGGWNLDESVALSRDLAALGCDLIDVSSGGLVRTQQIAIGPHYQVPFAQRIRAEANVATGAVGLITEPHAANEIVTTGQSDLVFLARELLRDPYWPLHAAHALGVAVAWPKQYERAKPPALVGAKGG
jgi:2,4-dienoyl-CoA reductase-like NADH-dependent reductase (Old Yellow Enzyme family)